MGHKLRMNYRKLSSRQVSIIFFVLLIVAMLPMLLLAKYSVPWYDDYEYTKYTVSFMDAYGHNLIQAVRGAFFQVKESYYAWQGTFSSIFFMAFSPIVWGEEFYFLGAVFLILILVASTLTLGLVICDRVFRLERNASFGIASLLALLVLLKLYSVPQGIYWYNAGVHYIGMHSAMMLLIAASVFFGTGTKVTDSLLLIILTSVLSLLVSGSNFVSALQGILFLLLTAAWIFCRDKKKTLLFIPAVCIYSFGLFKSLTAPGNAVRSAAYDEVALSPVQAILQSFVTAVRYIFTFTDLFTVVLLMLFATLIWAGIKNSGCRFRLPGVVLLLSFCLYATGFTPSLYAMGNEGVARTINAVKITYQLLLVFDEIYVIGYVNKVLTQKGKELSCDGVAWWFYVLCGVALCAVLLLSPNRIEEASSYGALYYLAGGEAQSFYGEYVDRIEAIETTGDADVLLPAYTHTPYFLCVDDLSADPYAEKNIFMAQFYGKDSLAITQW